MIGRLYGTATTLGALRGQARVPFLERSRLDALRDRRIREIVGYAARTVPFYRDWFARERIDPRDVRGARELDALPILDRKLVREQPELFLSTSRRAAGALTLRTSGSTGTPLEVRHDRRSILANVAYGERERAVVIALAGGAFRPKEIYLGFETSNFKKIVDFCARETWLPRPKRTTVSMIAPLPEIVAAVNRARPDVLVGYGGFLDEFFQRLAAEGVELHRPKVVMYVGERLPAERRAWIERETGAAVLSRYCAVEALKAGYFCESRTGFHLHDDLCHVRVVDAAGRDVASGESGEVVISNLVNHATVLLNYPMGDVAAFTGATCPCGRTGRLISEIDGRVEDLLVLPDGRTLHPRAVWAAIKGERGILQYQLIQHDRDRVELQLVIVDRSSDADVSARVRQALESLFGAGVRVDVSRVDQLGRDARATTGKFRAVESRVQR